MFVDVDALPTAGRRVRFALRDAWAARAAELALEGQVSRLEGEFEILAEARVVSVAADVHATASRTCERCGVPVDLALDDRVELKYLAAGRGVDSASEIELGSEELDVGWYDEGRLSLEVVLTEAIALQLPNRVVCADQAACDARTQEVLARLGDRETGHPGLQALQRFR